MTMKAGVFYYVTSKNYENEGLSFMSKVLLNMQTPDYLHIVHDNNGVTEYHYVQENDLLSENELMNILKNGIEVKESVNDLISSLRDIRGLDIDIYVDREIKRVEAAISN